jgi:hypothetical protein
MMDFDCILGGPGDTRYQMHYFRHYMFELFGNYGSLACLTNSGNAQGWINLGIDNIEENSWMTNADYLGEDDTANPILATFADGPYRIDIDSYPYDLDEIFTAEVDVELHNFSPVVSEVEINGSGGAAWEAHWEPVEAANGLVAEFVVETDEPAEAGQTLTATIVFSEPMNTGSGSYKITAGKAPDYDDLTVYTTGWSCTKNPSPFYDTWNGTIEIPSGGYSGRMTLRIEAEDTDGNCLKDPAGAFPSDEDYSDLYHGFGIAFGPQAGWTGSIAYISESSPLLADADGDGSLDIAIQDREGWVSVLDETGSSINANWPAASGWPESFPFAVKTAPVIVDLNGDGSQDIISTHHWGAHARDIATGGELPGWPVFLGTDQPELEGFYTSCASPAIGEIDGDGKLEVILCRVLCGNFLQSTVYRYEDSGGNCTWSCNLEPTLGGASVYATPAIGDVDGFGDVDVLVATAEGMEQALDYAGQDSSLSYNASGVYLLNGATGQIKWEAPFSNCHIYSAPVVADLENDGTNEVIFGTANCGSSYLRVHVLDGVTGNTEYSLPVTGWVKGPVGIGDLDEDGILDIAAGVNGGLIYAWSGQDHAILPGFPISVTGNPAGGVSIVDVDSDFELEIVAGTQSGMLYAINPDGSFCTGFPVNTGIGTLGQIAAGDIDGDGSLELVGAGSTAAQAYCYDMGSGSFPCEMPWRQFQHDSWHSGFYEANNTIPAAPTNLAATVTYTMFGYSADLSWDLSVNDEGSPDHEDPCDVYSYQIFRAFPPGGYSVIHRTHAGEGTYTDVCVVPGGPVARYVVTASDGPNESEYSNDIRFRTSSGTNLALGCRVREELEAVRVDDNSHDAAIGSTQSSTIHDVRRSSDVSLLTDGRLEETYLPDAGVSALVIDLGRECQVSNADIAGCEAPTGSAELDLTRCTVQISSDGVAWRDFGSTAEAALTPTEGRYIRLSPAPAASEVFVWGMASEAEAEAASIDIYRSSEGWSLAMPAMDDPGAGVEGTLSIYDISGRVVRSFSAESGEEILWDGLTGSGMAVAPGCYFVRFDAGDEAVISRLLVTGE